jgi:hypothetical protein
MTTLALAEEVVMVAGNVVPDVGCVRVHRKLSVPPSGFTTFVLNVTVCPTNTVPEGDRVGVDTVGVVAVTWIDTESAVVFEPPKPSVTVRLNPIECGYTKSGAGGTTNVGF